VSDEVVRTASKYSMQTYRSDFDRIASLSKLSDRYHPYHDFLLKQIPSRCERSLDIGCGTGSFTRALAARSNQVLALDLSPNMIEAARDHSREFSNIDFQIADAVETEFPSRHFDCIVSIATLHHLPMEEMIVKMKNALRPGGVLIILDLFQAEGLREKIAGVMAFPANIFLRLIKSGRLRPPREVRAAWAEHGRHDSYPTLSRVREMCAELVPGAEVRRHLLWRYSIVWEKADC